MLGSLVAPFRSGDPTAGNQRLKNQLTSCRANASWGTVGREADCGHEVKQTGNLLESLNAGTRSGVIRNLKGTSGLEVLDDLIYVRSSRPGVEHLLRGYSDELTCDLLGPCSSPSYSNSIFPVIIGRAA